MLTKLALICLGRFLYWNWNLQFLLVLLIQFNFQLLRIELAICVLIRLQQKMFPKDLESEKRQFQSSQKIWEFQEQRLKKMCFFCRTHKSDIPETIEAVIHTHSLYRLTNVWELKRKIISRAGVANNLGFECRFGNMIDRSNKRLKLSNLIFKTKLQQ